MSNLNRIFRYFAIKKIEIRDITDVINTFEEHIVKNKAQLIRKTKKTVGLFDTYEKKTNYINSKYIIILNKSLTFIPECSISELYKVLDKLIDGFLNNFKSSCSICYNEMNFKTDNKKCIHCNALYCFDCYNRFTNKQHVFKCEFCKKIDDTKNKELYYIEIKPNMLISY